MNGIGCFFAASALALLCSVSGGASTALAESKAVAPLTAPLSAEAVAGLPPALGAAVLSGKAEAIKQAIRTLSGGDEAKAADLALQLIKAAGPVFAADPKTGEAVVQIALEAVGPTSGQGEAPQRVHEVITAAAGLLTLPSVQALAPNALFRVADMALRAAIATGSPKLISVIAGRLVALADRVLAANNALALELTEAAVLSIKPDGVLAEATKEAMATAEAAARLLVRPEAKGAANPDMLVAYKFSLCKMGSSDTAVNKATGHSKNTTETLTCDKIQLTAQQKLAVAALAAAAAAKAADPAAPTPSAAKPLASRPSADQPPSNTPPPPPSNTPPPPPSNTPPPPPPPPPPPDQPPPPSPPPPPPPPPDEPPPPPPPPNDPGKPIPPSGS